MSTHDHDWPTCPTCWRDTPGTDLCEHDGDDGPLCINGCCQHHHQDTP